MPLHTEEKNSLGNKYFVASNSSRHLEKKPVR